VVTTSSGYGTDRLNAIEAGADEYIVKPVIKVEFQKLLNRLEFPERNDPENRATVSNQPVISFGKVIEKASPNSAFPMDRNLLRFWGVRGSIPTPGNATAYYGGNTACVELRADGEIIILDAGTGIRPLGVEMVSEFRDRPLNCTVLISHTHWDHIQGFPFFAPAYNPKNQIRILGYKGAKQGLETTLCGQMETPYFPIGLQQLPSSVVIEELQDLTFYIGKIKVEATFLNHPGICMGYRLTTSCGVVAYLPDNEPFQRYRYHSDNPSVANSAESLDFARQEDERIINFIQGVDVLIIDAQYDLEEYQERIGWGHGCLDDVVALALRANAKRLCLFHHDPGHNDEKIRNMVAWARDFVTALGEELIVEAAREGAEYLLDAAPFKPEVGMAETAA
jgi:phosphoribosyl 1,2-cyclic phosphodiesterase